MIIFLEKFNMDAFCGLLLLRNVKIIYLLDSVNFFWSHTGKMNLFEKIFIFLRPNIEIIRLPLYQRIQNCDDSKVQICWRANKASLEFLDSEFFIKKIKNRTRPILETIGDEKILIALKKAVLPHIFQKMLFYIQLAEMKIEGIEIDKVISTVHDTYDTSSYLNKESEVILTFPLGCTTKTFFDKSTALINALLFPHLLRQIIKRGITFKKIKPKNFDLGIHITAGFNLPIRSEKIGQKLNISDDLIVEDPSLEYSNTIFIRDKWHFDDQTYDSFKDHLESLGSSQTDFNKLKIPISFFFKEYFITYLSTLKMFGKMVSRGQEISQFEVLIYQKLKISILSHELLCKYFKIKIFFSRDDYDFDHIVRTIVQNKYGLKNFGLSHSAFDFPEILPFSAHTFFDKYYIFGPGFRKLWFPYWETNKSLLTVGTPREHEVIQAGQDLRLKKEFDNKYNKKITILILFSKPDEYLSPRKIMYRKYKDLDKLLDINEKLHVILKPRRTDAIDEFKKLFPEHKNIFESDRVTIDHGEWTTQELISYVNILVAEDTSGTILEGASRKDLVITSLRLRYPNHKYNKDISIEDLSELIPMIEEILKNKKVASNINAINSIRSEFTTLPPGGTWKRISNDIQEELKKF